MALESKAHWLCNFYPVKLPDGTMLAALVWWWPTSTTANAWKKYLERRRLQRKDQFLAMLAHELRNPLALISNAVQIMQLEGPNGRNFRWSTEVIEDQIKHYDTHGRRPA